MTDDRATRLRALAVRGSTEGERDAALTALLSTLDKPAPTRGLRVMESAGFMLGVAAAAFAWDWGMLGSIGSGLVFGWLVVFVGLDSRLTVWLRPRE